MGLIEFFPVIPESGFRIVNILVENNPLNTLVPTSIPSYEYSFSTPALLHAL